MKPVQLRRMMHLAEWREAEAQRRDLPRNRILRDETILDLAGTNPSTTAEFGKIRNFPGGANGKLATPVLALLREVEAMPDSTLPEALSEGRTPKPPAAVMELLRVLLKHITDWEGSPRASSPLPTSSRRLPSTTRPRSGRRADGGARCSARPRSA